ncbi:MAG: tetratricopeptide repeat protein [Saprospiraceae bacterium]
MLKNTFLLICSVVVIILSACKNNPTQEIVKTGNPLIDALSEQIALSPNSDTLHAQRAAAFYKEGIYSEAVKDMAKAMAIDSMNPYYHHFLADIYLDDNNSRMAIKTMERIVEIYPERIPSLLKLSELQMIVKLNKESIKTVSRILQLDKQNAEAFFMMGNNLKELGEKDRAIAAYKNCVAANADLVDGWINLGILLDEKKDNKAIEYLETALRIDSSSTQALHAKAMYYQNRNKLKEAIAIYKEIPKFDKDNADAFYNVGLLYLDLDSVKQAKDNFNIAVSVDPQYVLGYYFRGRALEMLGELADAKRDYEQTLVLSPNYQPAKDALEKINIKIKK